VAIQLLDDLTKTKKVTAEESKHFTQMYEMMHNRVVENREKQKHLEKQVRRKQNDVLGEKIKLERSLDMLTAEAHQLEELEAERDGVQKELDAAEAKDTVTKYELAELERAHSDLSNAKGDLVAANEAMVLPELERLEADLEGLKQEFKRQGEALEKEGRNKSALLERHEGLELELVKAQTDLAESKEVLAKAAQEPERARKQADSVYKAAAQLITDIATLADSVAGREGILEKQATRRTEEEEQLAALQRKGGLQQKKIEERNAEVAELQKVLDVERNTQHELVANKVKMELLLRGCNEDLRRAGDELSGAKKDYDSKKRMLRKKRAIADSVRELLPILSGQVLDDEHALRSYADENKRLGASIKEERREVDLGMARFMKQEMLEKGKREELEQLIAAVAVQETEVQQWQAEERKQTKLIALLAAQRELKARAATRATQEEKDTKQELKVKELATLDLTKKCNEVNNRLKEFSVLYEVVKNERNKYLNLIQASSQALAEMKEKIKILSAEVEILHTESLSKDKALAKEVSQHAMSKAARDSLRLELNRGQQEYRRKQEAVQQQIEEVKALNHIINGHEAEMLRLKRKYEESVSRRNEQGLALIERNDELCVLYEKANLQEQTLNGGESSVKQREEEVRALKLELTELERQLMVARKHRPGGADLAAKVRALEGDLLAQRETTARLCVDLESPENAERFRLLEGEDPDVDTLGAKIAVLEARLDEKKSLLLEKELVLEEVTTLTQKLKNRAGDGRGETLRLSAKVNDCQGRIRDVTRQMMATVSELSMYQATAMKLQQEKALKRAELEEMRWRVSHGKPPSDDAEREWFALEQQNLQRTETRLLRQQQNPASGDGAGDGAALALRTTAEPRPNAYIPDEIGIPKPYGGHAPFKPTEAGSTMRHMRNPNPGDIEI
jgi:hypothetical protein